MIPDIRIEDYNYPLPDLRIAKYPLEERNSSKLLVFKSGNISETVFREIPQFLPKDSLMVFNDTKVVPARLHFARETGARIEIFCLQNTISHSLLLTHAPGNALSEMRRNGRMTSFLSAIR